jgi:RNA-directed DNA polymerase
LAVVALEDEIVQRATGAVLNMIYEEDFLGFSYGFRPKRSPRDALDALSVGITSTKVKLHTGRRYRAIFRDGQPGIAYPFPESSHRRGASFG